ncbi:MAG: copper resistance protein CopC [Gemmatimonadales bacterium]|nr:copper resistance protein CopC [Gemmatimonadales bacterium]
MRRRALLLALSAALVASSPVPAAPALLHTALVKSAPAKAETLATPPTEVRLWFSQPIDAALASIELLKADASPLAKLAVTADPEDKKVVFGKLETPLLAGTYIVSWKTSSSDGHVVKGKYLFTVAAKAA